MAQGCIQCVNPLPAEQSSATVIYCCRNHYRYFTPLLHFHLLNRIECRFGIQTIIHCFNKQKISTSIHQSSHLLLVGLRHSVKINRPVLRSVHIWRKRQHLYCRPHRTCNKHTLSCSSLSGNLRALSGHLINQICTTILLLRYRIAAECIGFNDISTCLYIFSVNFLNYIRTGNIKNIIITGTTFEIFR